MDSKNIRKISELLPERYPQLDLFVCDISDAMPKDVMQEMEHPFYSLSKKPETRIRRYEHNGNWMEITPSVKGLATIYDKDILIYCISQIMGKLNRGEKVSKRVRINSHDLLHFTNRGTSGKDYLALVGAIDRLSGTRISTNIRTGDMEQYDTFGLIDSASVRRKHGFDGRLLWCDVTLSDWVFNAIEANEVLTLHRDYFRLRKPLERRIYEVGRKHCGMKEKWCISLEILKKKSGSLSPLKRFKQLVKGIIKNDHLPDYHLDMDDNDNVTFTRKKDSRVGVLSSGAHNKIKITYTVDNLDRYLDVHAREKCPKLARQKGIDYYFLKNEFVYFLNSKEAPDNISASFLSFIKQKKIV